MDLDDAPKKPANMVIGENLDAISVTKLEQRIQALESEIARLKAEIAKKKPRKNVALSSNREASNRVEKCHSETPKDWIATITRKQNTLPNG